MLLQVEVQTTLEVGNMGNRIGLEASRNSPLQSSWLLLMRGRRPMPRWSAKVYQGSTPASITICRSASEALPTVQPPSLWTKMVRKTSKNKIRTSLGPALPRFYLG